jgi:hypothetical protein
MLVSCRRCGRENDASQHFCGMCGAPLRGADELYAPATRSPDRPTGDVSFLGLNDSSETAEYLLTEVDGGGARRTLLIMLFFLVVGASAFWLWRHEASWRAGWLEETLRGVITRPSNAPPGSSDSILKPQEEIAPSDGIEDSSEQAAPNHDASHADVQSGSPASQAHPESSNDTNETAGGMTSSDQSKITQRKLQPSEAGVGQVDESNTEADALAAEGEKYLYGARGPQDCRRAQQSLMSAAEQSSPRAQALLGTMYATGHCAARDLPTAYLWFSRAQLSDPRNSRIREDRDLVWKEMTVQERQRAQMVR